MAGELRSKDCYVGQRVFWIMWCDPSDASESRTGWYGYRPGLSPEIWSATIERLPRNGAILLTHYGRASNIYACEIYAVRSAYEFFCSLHLGFRISGKSPSLGEASRVLRELAELEFGINTWASSTVSSTEWPMESFYGW